MIDFICTETGDIECEAKEDKKCFHLSFCLSLYKAQRIRFLSVPNPHGAKKKIGHHIRFKYVSPIEEYRLLAHYLEEDKEKIQALEFELKTELGDTLDDTIGSDFYQHRHDTIRNDESLEKIWDTAHPIVEQYFPDATTKVTYDIVPDTGNFQFQSIVLTITDTDQNEIATFIF